MHLNYIFFFITITVFSQPFFNLDIDPVYIDIKTTKMSDVMTKNPFVLSSDILAYNAVSLIQEKKITSIIVTKEKKVIGALNIHDLFRAGLM